MLTFPHENPRPDFVQFVQVVKGSITPRKVHFVEVLIDEEVKKYIIENYLCEQNVDPLPSFASEEGKVPGGCISEDYRKKHEAYYLQYMNFYCRMGYDLIPDHDFIMNLYSLNRVALYCKDTAPMSRGEREWAQGGSGMIKSWEDFEKFPWGRVDRMLSYFEHHLDFMQKNMPEGMGIGVVGAVFAPIVGWLLGFEGLFYMLHDDEELVKALFEKIGTICYKMYTAAVQFDAVGVLWHGDDLGFKTSTMISPVLLQKLLFPWMKRYADLAHENGRQFFIHCCGNKESIMEDFITGMGCDALHSFEDGCCPVVQYKRKYGNRIGLLGGIDVNVLSSLPEMDVRNYVRDTLDICMEGGRYALGSGNSITNFVSPRNYLAMLDEGSKWG
jgi:uroporphyrinogen decarboxylase